MFAVSYNLSTNLASKCLCMSFNFMSFHAAAYILYLMLLWIYIFLYIFKMAYETSIYNTIIKHMVIEQKKYK